MSNISFAISDICSAFNSKTIGSKVIHHDAFFKILGEATKQFDWSSCRVDGQAKIKLPVEANSAVSCGVGLSIDNSSYYVLRSHRGKVSAYLKREYAEQTRSVHVILYTKEAFLKDPDVTDEEREGIIESLCTHVVVAVLADVTDNPQLGAYRFVHNLAGGNREALVWTADEIREQAKSIISRENKYVTVAD